MKDNFSKQAALYAKYRPAYPPALFDFILKHVSGRALAWDCATGNGQTAKELAKYFEKIFATDISAKQIEKAAQHPSIIYSIQPAEQTGFADNSFDLITVSQALHWFRFNDFYKETKRVAKPGAVFAAWCYPLLFISPETDRLIISFYRETTGPYWDAERKYVDEKYQTIPFPFKEIKSPVFTMEYEWTINELEGYFNTWSALQKFIEVNDYNPVPQLIEQLRPFWKKEKMKIRFPLYLRFGIIEK